MRRGTIVCVTAAIGMSLLGGETRSALAPKRMSFHNRILLNRAVARRLSSIQVMLAVRNGAFETLSNRVKTIGGRVVRTFPAVGYARVDLPIEKLVGFAEDTQIEAYQISTGSRAAWYRDGQSQAEAEQYRGFERTAVRGVAGGESRSSLPPLSPALAREAGYTADEDTGVAAWMNEHPAFDGRGVTIAILETGTPEFRHPTFAPAKALGGADVSKLAGILNTIDAGDPDDTRVALDTVVRATSTWARAGDRTYILPRTGTFRFGLFTLSAASNLVHRFGILEDVATREMWVDTDGDTNFAGEEPIADVNERFDVRTLALTHPTPATLAFVVSRGRASHTVHIYVARSDHQTMTFGVAAGSRTGNGLAHGVAPGARVLLVRHTTGDHALHAIVEGYIEAASRPDVDVLLDASGISMGPDTAGDFGGVIFNRIIDRYQKPIFHSAGNTHQFVNTVSALGGVFSVGGSLGAPTFAALYGEGEVPALAVHHVSAGGPSIDGVLKPDFLAPMNRVAPGLLSLGPRVQVPKVGPDYQLPAGYSVSCCTSASAPYAAGIGALLISAARQERLAYSLADLASALRSSARFLPDYGAHLQGNGVLDVGAAWEALKRRVERPVIRATARIVHPLAPYGARADEGSGIFERSGWRTGMTAVRDLELRRESGPAGPVSYRVAWRGNDGTFSAPPTVTLPLHVRTVLPISIAIRRPGAHSAILQLQPHDDNVVVFRTQATIVAPEDVDPRTHAIAFAGVVPLMNRTVHYLHVPPQIEALHVDLQVVRGSVSVTPIPANTLVPPANPRVLPQVSRTMTTGKYVVLLPRPVSGTWAFDVANIAAFRERNQALVTTGEAEYRLTVRLLRASVVVEGASSPAVVKNLGADLREPAVRTSAATRAPYHGRTRDDGLPNVVEISVPTGATTFRLDLRSAAGVELYLYDCTSGECFLHDCTIPFSTEQRLVVRRPNPGRWLAAVNTAPLPAQAAVFALDAIVAADRDMTVPFRLSPMTAPILLHELFDRALLADEERNPWETREIFVTEAIRPAAIGSAVQALAPGALRGKGAVR